jgi:phosphopantetheinyl transferase (holo-ACP synthase)
LIGNDVVDLRDADARPDALNRRFDARVFSSAERLALDRNSDPTRHRWRLWSAKEASYKVARKLDASASFSPVRFEVELDRDARGRVRYRGHCFAVRVLEREGGVHALARPESAPEAELLHALLRLSHGDGSGAPRPDELSRAVRRLACEHLAPRLGVAPGDLEIRKHDRIPQLWLGGEPLSADLSLSHHGELVAFACALRPVAS